MTKQHFIAIAAIILGDYTVASAEQKTRIRLMTYSLADYFMSQNSRFDRARFYKACGF